MVQTAGRCSTTVSGVATRCSVSPRWPSCPPGFLPLGFRRLFVRRFNPSLEGGLPLVWLSLAARASSSCTRANKALTCARSAAFSASSSVLRASSVMPQCYTCSASPPDLLHHFHHIEADTRHNTHTGHSRTVLLCLHGDG